MFRRLRTVRSGFSTFTSSWLRISLAMAFCTLALALSVSLAPASFSAARAALASSSSMMQITPSSGNTLTDSSGALTFTGGPYLVPNASSQVDGIPICNQALPCDEYTLMSRLAPPPRGPNMCASRSTGPSWAKHNLIYMFSTARQLLAN